ncbi:MAG: D-alanyl-D-alanine carboxypeptidase/D-alanyl-D-alanine endopeptidase [Bacteroidia bacterium]
MRNSNKYLLYACALLVLIGFSAASVPSRIQTEIDALNRDPDLKHGAWGFSLITADSGKLIAAHNEQQYLLPASTMKIFTTAAALGELGTDYRYETVLESDGLFDSITGILHGNLYIRGSGDPTLESRYFRKENDSTTMQKWAAILYRKGVRKIDGKIIGDASLFGNIVWPDGWTWGDMGQYYGAQTSGLAYHDNSYALYFNSDAKKVTLDHTDLTVPNLRLEIELEASGSKDEAFIYGAPYKAEQTISGSIPANKKNYEVEAALPDPALQCAADLKIALNERKIESADFSTARMEAQKKEKKVTDKMRPWHVHVSIPLSEIVYWTNLKSDNVYAEQLLRTVSVKKKISADEPYGKAIKEYWLKKGLAFDLECLNADGSGLSRTNYVTTHIQAQALQIISKETYFNVFKKSLPVAGKSGSLASMGKGTAAEGHVFAKSGYINRVRGYAGYVQTRSGKMLCFSLLANNYSCSAAAMKKKLEKFLIAMAELD